MLENLLLLSEEALTAFLLFNGESAKTVSISYKMSDGETNTIDLQTFQKCVRRYLEHGNAVNFQSLANNHKDVEYIFSAVDEKYQSAFFAKNKLNGYLKFFRNESDADLKRYYDIVFSVASCSNYTLNKVCEMYQDKIILGKWLDLSNDEIQDLKNYFQTLCN